MREIWAFQVVNLGHVLSLPPGWPELPRPAPLLRPEVVKLDLLPPHPRLAWASLCIILAPTCLIWDHPPSDLSTFMSYLNFPMSEINYPISDLSSSCLIWAPPPPVFLLELQPCMTWALLRLLRAPLNLTWVPIWPELPPYLIWVPPRLIWAPPTWPELPSMSVLLDPADLSNPMSNLSYPMSNLSYPMSNLSYPMSNLSYPMSNLS